MKTKNCTPKMKQPKPLKIVHPSSLLTAQGSSSREQQDTPVTSDTHASFKRKRSSTSKKPSSSSVKKAKITVHLNAEELSKEMSVGFGLDKI